MGARLQQTDATEAAADDEAEAEAPMHMRNRSRCQSHPWVPARKMLMLENGTPTAVPAVPPARGGEVLLENATPAVPRKKRGQCELACIGCHYVACVSICPPILTGGFSCDIWIHWCVRGSCACLGHGVSLDREDIS